MDSARRSEQSLGTDGACSMVENGGARQGSWVLHGRVANQKMVLGSIVSQTAKCRFGLFYAFNSTAVAGDSKSCSKYFGKNF